MNIHRMTSDSTGKNLSTIHPTIIVDDRIRETLAKNANQEIPFSDYEVERFVKDTVARLFVILEDKVTTDDDEDN